MNHSHSSNLILIGMPGCGKSTLGVVLAKKLGFGFIDTDLLIQQSHRKRLQDIVNEQGYLVLRQLEEKILTSLATVQHVIATGGSAVYSEAGMKNLKTLGKVIYLQVGFDELKNRVGDFSERGIASEPDSSLETIYTERSPLYQSYADVMVECGSLTTEQVVEKIVAKTNAPN